LSKKLSQQIDVLEKKYRRQEVIEETRIKSIDELTAEALAQLEKGEYALAEKNLIEIIARDKKNFSAYELLAEIYRLNRSYDQAEEVLKYLIKLKSLRYRRSGQEPLKKVKFEDLETAVLQAVDIDHDLSRYYDDLAKVYEAMDKRGRALDAYLKANTILPNNPKFLDKITELAIAEKDIGLAKKTFRQLREINPDNAKLLHFFEALEKMK
jgi:Tfp pilus assembly protein PilF